MSRHDNNLAVQKTIKRCGKVPSIAPNASMLVPNALVLSRNKTVSGKVWLVVGRAIWTANCGLQIVDWRGLMVGTGRSEQYVTLPVVL